MTNKPHHEKDYQRGKQRIKQAALIARLQFIYPEIRLSVLYPLRTQK